MKGIYGWLLAATLAGCAGNAAQERTPVQHDGALDQASLSFDGHRVSGTGGCNRVFGPARVEQGRLIVGNLASTRMACPDNETGDQALIDFLESRPRLIQGDNDEWRLEGESQQMAIERVPMQ
ncbi:META domain-containing protein [Kushneria indalinina]|uniref:META domain-containing protein n=1 Tax=Kushneria indalinina DSM 14324 TaxID=1122140 RepID=A0A3D9DVG7_9GAMM|nr:META domain-containing protein [Kushneria indalinina]REC94746.1 META domain-containing protein [Kushneria indalinina DSM 14324]